MVRKQSLLTRCNEAADELEAMRSSLLDQIRHIDGGLRLAQVLRRALITRSRSARLGNDDNSAAAAQYDLSKIADQLENHMRTPFHPPPTTPASRVAMSPSGSLTWPGTRGGRPKCHSAMAPKMPLVPDLPTGIPPGMVEVPPPNPTAPPLFLGPPTCLPLSNLNRHMPPSPLDAFPGVPHGLMFPDLLPPFHGLPQLIPFPSQLESQPAAKLADAPHGSPIAVVGTPTSNVWRQAANGHEGNEGGVEGEDNELVDVFGEAQQAKRARRGDDAITFDDGVERVGTPCFIGDDGFHVEWT